MKIAYLTAGAGGMYCGSCLHDNTLAGALVREGEDIVLIPTYTPVRTDEEDVSLQRVFYGGINVYLQQKSALFRHTPWWLDRWLDVPALLRAVTRGAASVRPESLGDLTVSMLQGERGRQRKELDKLVYWLEREIQPDVVHLSNSMLLGMAGQLRKRLGVPIVCSLSGEDVFLERLIPPHYDRARALLRERAEDADAFVALNNYYADYMVDYMEIDRGKIHVIPHGLKLAGHSGRDGRAAARSATDPFTIGYLARLCPDKGLHILTDAFAQLAEDSTLPEVRLRVAGYLGDGDRDFYNRLVRQLAERGLSDRFEYIGEPDRAGKIDFLHTIDAMALPTVYRESKGLSVLEAMANAVPVVLPDHGAFPELIADTGAGLLCRHEDPASLANELRRYIQSPDEAREHGRRGHEAIRDRYHDTLMAQRHRDLYQQLIDPVPRLGAQTLESRL